MRGHCSGEVWGLCDDGVNRVFTSGDDNRVMVWSPAERKCESFHDVNQAERKAKKNRASTLGTCADSQSSRAVSYNPHQGHLAVGANDGSVTIRSNSNFGAIVKEIQDSKEWIEAIEYSPCGNYLAVGSHDSDIYIYDVSNGYNLIGKCISHNAAITSIDWDCASSYIRSVCNGYELLFHRIPDC